MAVLAAQEGSSNGVAVVEPSLSDAERDRLADLERVVDAGLSEFVAVGCALSEIRDSKLYRATDKTFADYCRRRWSLSPSRAEQVRASALVHNAIVEHTGRAPQASANALRMLAPVVRARGGKAAAEVFEKARAQHGEKPSAVEVRQAVTDSGVTPYARQANRRTTLPQIGDALLTARRRVDRLRGELAGASLGAEARESARAMAAIGRGLAAELDELGGVAAVPEREPLPEDELCIGHGLSRDERGVCRKCGRADVQRNQHGLLAPAR